MNYSIKDMLKDIDVKSMASVKDSIFQSAIMKNASANGVRADVMRDARESVRSTNPFAYMSSNSTAPIGAISRVSTVQNTNKLTPQKRAEIRAKIQARMQGLGKTESIFKAVGISMTTATAMREEVMVQARKEIALNEKLLGTLNYINSQASMKTTVAGAAGTESLSATLFFA